MRELAMPMHDPPHPGASVRYDCLAPLDLSVTDGARVLGVSRKQLSALVNGRAGISPEMAIRLDKAFGGGAGTWYQLQAAYDMAQALRRADEIQVNVPEAVLASRERAGRYEVGENSERKARSHRLEDAASGGAEG